MILAEDERGPEKSSSAFPWRRRVSSMPRACAMAQERRHGNSRPMMMATIQAGASSICTSEMNAGVVADLSANGSMNWPRAVTYPGVRDSRRVGERREGRRWPPTSSLRTPRIIGLRTS